MSRSRCWFVAWFLSVCVLGRAWAEPLDFEIDLQTVLTHDDGEFLWFHPRAAAIPNDRGVILTLQKHLHQSDFYSGVFVMRLAERGEWEGPVSHPQLDWQWESEEVVVAVCDVTPGWHGPTGKVIAIGAKVRYRDGVQLYDIPQSRAAAYAVYDPKREVWSAWTFIDMPDPVGKFRLVTPGCTQWSVKENGDVLLPIYYQASNAEPHRVTVLRCTFDGANLRYVEHGDELTLDVERGLVEPSLVKFGGDYFLTIRNDVKGYVTRSSDGLHYQAIKPWTFDDGSELGSYNTQQHWLAHSEGLFLVYTRRAGDNDHVMRHRAPLFMAGVNPESLEVIRATERVIVPERGATLGNFGATAISPSESWVTVSEGVWSDEARERGATGATFVARIVWNKPNLLASD